MASSYHGNAAKDVETVDISTAFQEVARGERAAETLERNLTALERKIDDLLKHTSQGAVRTLKEDNGPKEDPNDKRKEHAQNVTDTTVPSTHERPDT